MPRPTPLLIVLSREVLHLTQSELAALVGSSERTVQRWEDSKASPSPWHLHRLADAVRPRDPMLASELDELAPRPTPAPAPPPPPPAPAPAPPPIPPAVLVDAVVCAAAEAMSLAPQALRPALLAAFTRARDAGLTLDAVVEVLAPPAAKGRQK